MAPTIYRWRLMIDRVFLLTFAAGLSESRVLLRGAWTKTFKDLSIVWSAFNEDFARETTSPSQFPILSEASNTWNDEDLVCDPIGTTRNHASSKWNKWPRTFADADARNFVFLPDVGEPFCSQLFYFFVYFPPKSSEPLKSTRRVKNWK